MGISIGGGLGPVRASVGLRLPRRRGGSGGRGGAITAFLAIALVIALVYYALAWPWYLGSWVAVELGASNPSTTRSVVAWIFEGIDLTVILGFLALLAWMYVEERLETRRGAARDAAERVRAEAEQRAEEEGAAAVRHLDKAAVPIRNGEAALTGLNDAIAEYRTWACHIETHPVGAPAARTGPEEAVPDGELALGVLSGMWRTLHRVDGLGGAKVQTAVDCGDLIVTDHAIRFEGLGRREEWRLDRIERRTIKGRQVTFAVRGRKTISDVRARRTTATNVMLAVLDWADKLPGQPVKALVRPAGASVTAQERLRDVDAKLTRDQATRDRLREHLSQVLEPGPTQEFPHQAATGERAS